MYPNQDVVPSHDSARQNDINVGVQESPAVQPSRVSVSPVDTGMFFTGSFDGVVAGWDTNECRRVVSFDMTDKIYAVGGVRTVALGDA